MKVAKLAIIGILAGCVVSPAAAAKKQNKSQASAPTWVQCHIGALQHGLHHGHAGNAEYMKECLAGKIRP
jgi:hypothetical protein